MQLSKHLMIVTAAWSVCACHPGDDPDGLEPAECADSSTVLACLDAQIDCDWYADGCAPAGEARDLSLLQRYDGDGVELPGVTDAVDSSLSTYRTTDGRYLALIAVETETSTLVLAAEAAVTPAGAVSVTTDGLECFGLQDPCDTLSDGRFGGRIDEDQQLVFTEYDQASDAAVELRFVPHNGVKPVPGERDPPPIDPDPIAGRYQGELLTKSGDEFLQAGCSFVVSVDPEGDYYAEREECPLGEIVPDTFRFDAEENRFSLRLETDEHRVVLVGDVEKRSTDELARLQGAILHDFGQFPASDTPPPEENLSAADLLGTFSFDETGIER